MWAIPLRKIWNNIINQISQAIRHMALHMRFPVPHTRQNWQNKRCSACGHSLQFCQIILWTINADSLPTVVIILLHIVIVIITSKWQNDATIYLLSSNFRYSEMGTVCRCLWFPWFAQTKFIARWDMWPLRNARGRRRQYIVRYAASTLSAVSDRRVHLNDMRYQRKQHTLQKWLSHKSTALCGHTRCSRVVAATFGSRTQTDKPKKKTLSNHKKNMRRSPTLRVVIIIRNKFIANQQNH